MSWQVVTGEEAKDLFGTKAKGYMILTREGRAMTVTTADARAPGASEPERAARLSRCPLPPGRPLEEYNKPHAALTAWAKPRHVLDEIMVKDLVQ